LLYVDRFNNQEINMSMVTKSLKFSFKGVITAPLPTYFEMKNE
jgi:hypothetical protein